MDEPSTVHMRESYFLKSHIRDLDTLTYIEALSSENVGEYYKAVGDEIQSLIRRDTWEIVSGKSGFVHNVLPVKIPFKCNRKPDWTIRKFKARYFVRGGLHKRLSTESLN